MGNIPNARRSPRLVNGIIRWYEGDTFTLKFNINLKDENGDPIDILTQDAYLIEIRNASNEVVYQTAGNLANGSFELYVDNTLTTIFTAGEYRYDIRIYLSERDISTIVKSNTIIVDGYGMSFQAEG